VPSATSRGGGGGDEETSGEQGDLPAISEGDSFARFGEGIEHDAQCGVENSKLDDRKREVIRECDPMIPWRRLISPENRMVCRYHGDSDEPYVMY
jgi:hypothetical protein